MATNRATLPQRGPQITTRGHFGDLEVIGIDIGARTATFRVRNPGGALVGPDTTIPLSAIRPLSGEDTRKFWEMLVDDVVDNLKKAGNFPNFVKGYEVSTGEDSTDDPALYVKVLVSPQQKYSHATASQWNAFSSLLQEQLHGLRLQRYPYVQIGEKKRSK